jgi:tight adherence protein B
MSLPAFVSAALTGALVLVSLPTSGASRLAALHPARGARASRPGAAGLRRMRPSRPGVLWTVMAGAAWQVAGLPAVSLVVAGSLVLRRRRRRARVAVAAAESRAAVIELCAGLAAELRAGRQPEAALVTVSGDAPPGLLSQACLAVSGAGDVAEALRRDGASPGAHGLLRLAACWQVAAAVGSAMAPPVTRLTAALRDEEAGRRELQAHLASPRATARLLAGLPVVGVGMGSALGADPMAILLRTPLGWMCLAGGGLLTLLGVLWVDRLAAGTERALGFEGSSR